MAVVAFDDFDVVAFIEDAGDGVEDVESKVDADAEVGSEDNACFFVGGLDGSFACVVETGSADDDVDAFFNAFLQVFEGRLGAGEVNEYVVDPILFVARLKRERVMLSRIEWNQAQSLFFCMRDDVGNKAVKP